MKKTGLVIVLSALSMSGAYASGPAGTVTFQGVGFVEAVNSTCSALNYAVGDY